MIARATRLLPAGHGQVSARVDSAFYSAELMKLLCVECVGNCAAPGCHGNTAVRLALVGPDGLPWTVRLRFADVAIMGCAAGIGARVRPGLW
jgi:hypothetical protein